MLTPQMDEDRAIEVEVASVGAEATKASSNGTMAAAKTMAATLDPSTASGENPKPTKANGVSSKAVMTTRSHMRAPMLNPLEVAASK